MKHYILKRQNIILIILTATPLGSIIGAYVLDLKPLGDNRQLHNYSGVFLLSLCGFLLAVIWSIFTINEKKDLQKINLYKTEDNNLPEKNSEQKVNNQITTQTPMMSTTDSTEIVIKRYSDTKSALLGIFDLSNLKDIWGTISRKRENKGRIQLWVLLFAMVFILLVCTGPQLILFQFCQRVYLWDFKEFSYINAVATITNSIGAGIVYQFLNFFKLIEKRVNHTN